VPENKKSQGVFNAVKRSYTITKVDTNDYWIIFVKKRSNHIPKLLLRKMRKKGKKGKKGRTRKKKPDWVSHIFSHASV
jgi:hypothetical protein